MTPVDELPPREEERSPTFVVVSLGLTVGVMVESFVLHRIAGRFAGMFEDFEARLPTLTMLFIGWLGYVFALGFCALGVGISGVGFMRGARRLEIAGLVLVVAVALLLPVLAFVGLYLPIFELAENVSR